MLQLDRKNWKKKKKEIKYKDEKGHRWLPLYNRVESAEINPCTYGQLIYDKGIYSGGKIVSSISGAGKTGQLHVKEWN